LRAVQLPVATYRAAERRAAEINAEYEATASTVIKLMDSAPPPDWFQNTMFKVLHEVADRLDMDLWKEKDDAEVLDPAKIARLFMATQRLELNSPKSKLVAAVREVLTNPLTPAVCSTRFRSL
jgi:hypothetical protein